jgi:hypothetical protein
MKWLLRLLGQRGDVVEETKEDAQEATRLKEQLDQQADEIRKLTHSLRVARQANHLSEAIIRAMRSSR